MWVARAVCAGACLALLNALQIAVVDENLGRGLQLEAAVRAASTLDAEPAEPLEPVLAAVEPDERLAVPHHVCLKAEAGAVAALSGCAGCGGASAGAARAGLALLLPARQPAPPPPHRGLALFPHPDLIAQAVVEVCVAKGWSRAVLLHEGSAAPAALLAPDAEPLWLLARRLPAGEPALRNLLLVLKKGGAAQFVVWGGAAAAERVLSAAQRAGLLGPRASLLLAAPDLRTRPLATYSHAGANITVLQLFNHSSENVTAAARAWRAAGAGAWRVGGAGAGGAGAGGAGAARGPAPATVLLAVEAAALAARAWARLALPELGRAACRAGRAAFHADTLLNYLRSEEWRSPLSEGLVSWEWDGGRRGAVLGVAELERGGRLRRVAAWAPRAGLAWARPPPPPSRAPEGSMANRTFTVIIAKNSPYVMQKESTDRLSGNDRYEGFCIELIERLAEILQFNYTFVESEGGGYGSLDPRSGQWSGMLRRLMDDPNIHFAITDLTITAQREKAVDFTTPFMNLGISILFRTPEPPEPELFAFLQPFSKEVWLWLGLAYVGTSLVLYVVGRLCPEEWQNPHPCVDEPPALTNQFTLANALWFNLGAVLLQGSEIAPVAYGTRSVASMWWLFALVITSSYTANLASLLAKKSTNELIHNVQELADNPHGIRYGAKENGSTHAFFQASKSELYQRMYQQMMMHPLPKDDKIGIEKVKNEKYAYLMESTTIEYTIERICAVTKVGGLLDSKGYGIAMKKESPYRQALNLALLRLQEGGVLRQMKYKWWKEKHGGGACSMAGERESERLKMSNLKGLFLVLVVGCAVGVVLSAGDLAAAARRRRGPRGYMRALADELRFVFRFNRSVKPVEGPLIEPSEHSPSPAEEEAVRVEEEEEAGSAERGGEARGSPAPRPRRRSSMHAASLRLARHARRDSAASARARRDSAASPRQRPPRRRDDNDR